MQRNLPKQHAVPHLLNLVKRQVWLVLCRSRLCGVMTSVESISLVDLLCEVPRLWDFLRGHCLKTLLGTSTLLRSIAHQHVTHVGFPNGWQSPEIHTLVSRKWLQLQVLDLQGNNITAAAAVQLSNATWPLLKRLLLETSLYLGSAYDSQVFHNFQGKWSLMQSLTVKSGKLDHAEVVALTQIDWPSLHSLTIDAVSGALPALWKGNWPQLRHLSIGDGLNDEQDEDMQHLSTCPWSSLNSLELHNCTITTEGMAHLVQAHLPQLKHLALVNVRLSQGWPDGDWAHIATLAKGNWPYLTTLEVTSSVVDAVCIDELIFSDWPHLQALSFQGCFSDRADKLIARAPWATLTCLKLCGSFDGAWVMIDECMHRWPALQSLTLGPSRSYAYLTKAIIRAARRIWPLLLVQFID